MKFSAKLAMGCLSLVAGTLCAAGLLLTGYSFSGSLQNTRAALQAQQSKEKYAVEKGVLTTLEETRGNWDQGDYAAVYALSTAAQNFAEQTGASLTVLLNGISSVYTNLPPSLPQADLLAAAGGGAGEWRLIRTGDTWYILMAQRLALPGIRAVMVCAYDVGEVFAARRAQMRLWLAAALLFLAAGGGVAVTLSRRLTAPLTTLQAASGRIAAGDYASRTGIETGDEIEALSRSFDAMAAAVQEQIGARDATVQRQKDFIAAFSHEIKTPMTAMLGYADLMRAKPQDAALQKEAADYIYHETRRLETLSRHLLALMQLEGTEPPAWETAADTALFAQVVRSLPPGSLPPRVIPCGCPVRGDRALLVDLLRNLTLNAQRACQGIEGASVTLRCVRREGKAEFSVCDTGCGIPAADLPRVTEAFYMVDKSRARAAGGSGIGLALCSRIAALHGTELRFESAEGSGTTVSFMLPEALEASEPSQQEAHHDTE